MSTTSSLRVIPIASSIITPQGWDLFHELGFDPFDTLQNQGTTDGDILPEFAGRGCYQSYHKPNPATVENKDYIRHTAHEMEHESILEHTSVTFYVDGISRNVLLELERHRHISLSVVSTRYVAQEKFGVALHPNTPDEYKEKLLAHDTNGRMLANEVFNFLKEKKGFGVKQAREVSRQHLGGNTETKFVVTGNLRAWRYIVNLRWHPKADKEIQDFAYEVLKGLHDIAPHSVQDLPPNGLTLPEGMDN